MNEEYPYYITDYGIRNFPYHHRLVNQCLHRRKFMYLVDRKHTIVELDGLEGWLVKGLFPHFWVWDEGTGWVRTYWWHSE